MNESNWIQIVTAIGAVATPILILILTGVGRGIGMRLERRMEREDKLRERQFEREDKILQRQIELQDKLREDRITTYNEILEPFIILLTTDTAWQSDPKNRNRDRTQVAIQKMLRLEYRQQGFRLSLVGSDAVVEAYNNLMQYFFQRGDEGSVPTRDDITEMMSFLGQFLLEIRRSMGNETTQLSNWQMLEWFMQDAREFARSRRESA
jgi:hypothetical protein